MKMVLLFVLFAGVTGEESPQASVHTTTSGQQPHAVLQASPNWATKK